ncbi:MAG TPA: hypothetical protein PLH94_08425 [Fimbriimonadaceae bacterium]|nr:hypothetical protein [Fimbriimonadaceae bacterium]
MPPEFESEALADRLLAVTLNIAEAVRNGSNPDALVRARDDLLDALQGRTLTAYAQETLYEVTEWDRRIVRLAAAQQTRLAASIQDAANGRRLNRTYRSVSRLTSLDQAG